ASAAPAWWRHYLRPEATELQAGPAEAHATPGDPLRAIGESSRRRPARDRRADHGHAEDEGAGSAPGGDGLRAQDAGGYGEAGERRQIERQELAEREVASSLVP